MPRGGANRGQGRKPASADVRLRQRAIYLSDAEWDHCSYHWSLGVSASEYVRRLVQNDIRRVACAASVVTSVVTSGTHGGVASVATSPTQNEVTSEPDQAVKVEESEKNMS